MNRASRIGDKNKTNLLVTADDVVEDMKDVRRRRTLTLVAGKNFLTWKGQNYEDYLQHDSLFKFRQSSEERSFYVGLNRVVESVPAGKAGGLTEKSLRRARRVGSGLCEVVVSLSKAQGQ